jgi:hypothetical protein
MEQEEEVHIKVELAMETTQWTSGAAIYLHIVGPMGIRPLWDLFKEEAQITLVVVFITKFSV